MRTPSLTMRVTVASLVLLALVLGALNLFLYFTLRQRLLSNLAEVLDTRSNIVRAEAAGRSPEDLARRLTQLGIRATVTAPDGATFEARPPSPVLGPNLPPGSAGLGKNPATRVVALPGGVQTVVFARRTGVAQALSSLLLFQVLGTVVALLVAALLVRRISKATLRPVDEIAAASRRVAAGERGARLRPDRPTTPLGELATAYDAMLDELEAALHASREAEERSEQLAAIVDSARDAVVSQDLDGNIVSWNRGAEIIYGWRAEEVIGRPISIIVPPQEAATRATMVERVRTGRATHTVETVRRCKNGTLLDVSVTFSPVLDRSGAVVRVSTIARDITEQRWMARTLDETLKALQTALDQAHRSEAYSRRFLADAAHQLRSPITGIRACTETLLRGVPGHERDRLMMHLVREASRATRLLGGLLRLARLDQGEELASEQADLVALCHGEADRARTLAPHLEIVVDSERAPEALPDLDPSAVQEVLANLLDNARRHAAGRIVVGVRGSEDAVEVRVEDDGPGMTAEVAERAFERFVSIDGKGGSGLGLPIAQALARAQGGDLSYEEGEAGKAFVLRLPVESGSGPGTPPVDGPREPLTSGR